MSIRMALWDVISESAGTSVISYYENAMTSPYFSLDVVDSAYPGNGRPGWSAAGDSEWRRSGGSRGRRRRSDPVVPGSRLDTLSPRSELDCRRQRRSRRRRRPGRCLGCRRSALQLIPRLVAESGSGSVTGTWVRYTIDGGISPLQPRSGDRRHRRRRRGRAGGPLRWRWRVLVRRA